jgi:hypothetical protein
MIDEEEITTTPAPAMFDPNPGKPKTASSSYYDMMLSMADLGSKEKNLKQQAALAEELRGTAMPGVRSAGATIRAAHPLEFLNAGLKQAGGGQMRRKVIGEQETLANEIRRRIEDQRNMAAGGGNTYAGEGY